MIKQLLELISDLCPITGNDIIDTILFSIIGFISFAIAFGFVGDFFDKLGYYDSDIMSDTHWIIRFVVFIGLYFLFVFMSNIVKWLFSIKWWIYLIAFILILGLIFLISILKHNKMKKKPHPMVIEEFNEINEHVNNVVVFETYRCPRCGGKLVYRHGPYGSFYGCENFPKNGCKYTRKHL